MEKYFVPIASEKGLADMKERKAKLPNPAMLDIIASVALQWTSHTKTMNPSKTILMPCIKKIKETYGETIDITELNINLFI